MTRTVRVLKRAERDLGEIHRYVARDKPSAADDLLERLLGAIESLSEHAERGARPRDERLLRLGYQYLVREPYLVFYKVLPRQVRSYRILHGRRLLGVLLG